MFSNKKLLLPILGAFVLTIGIAVFSIKFSDNLSERNSQIENIFSKDDKIYLIKKTEHYWEDGNYYKFSVIITDTQLHKTAEIKLDNTDFTQFYKLPDHLVFSDVDSYNRMSVMWLVPYDNIKQIVKVDKDYLQKKYYPQGVHEMAYEPTAGAVKVTDKQGRYSYLSLNDLEKYDDVKEIPAAKIYEDLKISDTYIIYKGYALFKLTGESKRKRLTRETNQSIQVGFQTEEDIEHQKAEEAKNTYQEADFLDAGFLGASLTEQKILILSFSDTDHTQAQITCFDMDLKLLWQTTSTKLGIKTNLQKEIHTCAGFHKDEIILTFNKQIIAVNANTGKLLYEFGKK